MAKIEVLSFDEWIDYIILTQQQKVLRQNEDLVALVCGYEGNGKTTFTLATYCGVCKELGIKPRQDLIFFQWDEYLKTCYAAIKQKKMMLPKDYLEEAAEDSGIDLEQLERDLEKLSHVKKVDKGDFLIYDESGTQNFAREAMSRGNINQAKLMMANRFLQLMHWWNLPTPVACDKYVREHRAKMLVWVDSYYTSSSDMMWDQKVRNIYIWGKESYTEILNTPYWHKYFSTTMKLTNSFKPDIRITDTDNIIKYIPKKLINYYDAKKVLFNLTMVGEMIKGDTEIEPKKGINHGDRLVTEGESRADWCIRTNLSPTQYYAYGGKKEWRG